MNASEISAKVRSGDVTAASVLEACLQRLRNEPFNAFLHIDEASARAAARSVDAALIGGRALGPLAGVPIALKDNIVTQGLPTTAGSRILEGWTPPYSATVVDRLRAAGAIIVGKTNLDEFAMGSSTESSAFGPTLNPVDTQRIPGGSSGGSAAAVAGGLVPIALGSDTGGSIRQPAALCGVVGMKPTWGCVSRYGLIAFASSLDQIGPFATTVRDCAATLSVLSGYDPRDSTSAQRASDALELDGDISGLRVGVPEAWFGDGLDPRIEAQIRQRLAGLEAAGATLVAVELPDPQQALATYYVIAPAEASSNLARYDGVRFGLRSHADGLDDMYRQTRAAGFGAEVKRRIVVGTYALSAGYYDAYYRRAQKVRSLIRRGFEQALSQCDVIVTPTSPVVAPRIGEVVDPLSMYLMDVYTVSANLAGIPAISLPAGRVDGLPTGLQIMGRHWAERTVLNAALAVEAL